MAKPKRTGSPKLSADQYLKERVCPMCRSKDVQGGPVDTGDGYATQELVCSECSASWTDVYTLVRYERLTNG